MKKARSVFWIFLFLICFTSLFFQEKLEVQAAVPEKVPFAKQAKKGHWVTNSNGVCYRYSDTNTYAKKIWFSINGKVYYIDKDGYRTTGLKKYKKRFYYLNEKGVMTSGWKDVGNRTYFFSMKHGAAIRGWQTIDGYHYYFKENGVLLRNAWVGDYYVGADGYMLRNTKVADYYLGPDGKRILQTEEVKEADTQLIFLGDSRTVGLKNTIGGETLYIGKMGEGHYWLQKKAVVTLNKYLKKVSKAKVIINLGVNDLPNIEHYIESYRHLIIKYPTTQFYFMSVNPVEKKLAAAQGYNVKSVNNTNIKAFNKKLQEAFPANYLDTYSYLTGEKMIRNHVAGFGTVDGIHYKTSVYQAIYKFVLEKINY